MVAHPRNLTTLNDLEVMRGAGRQVGGSYEVITLTELDSSGFLEAVFTGGHLYRVIRGSTDESKGTELRCCSTLDCNSPNCPRGPTFVVERDHANSMKRCFMIRGMEQDLGYHP